MNILLQFLISIIALLHLYFLWFEMFAWTSKGKKIFPSFPADLFEPTRSMAANQGLYNGFLAAGLLWSLFIADEIWRLRIAAFFLCCIAVAGIFGALTASRKIFWVQGFPALLALLLILFI